MLFSHIYTCLLAITPQVLGQAWEADKDGTSDYRGERSFGASAPGNVTDEEWPPLMADYDLIGRWPIPGYNISQRYRDADSMDDWTVTLTIRERIMGRVYDTDGVFAGAMVRLEPPAALVDDVIERDGLYTLHPSWRVSIGYYHFDRYRNKYELEKLRQGNGSCKAPFNETCLYILEHSPTWNGREWKNQDIKDPEECPLNAYVSPAVVAQNYTQWSDEIPKDKAKNVTWLRGTEFVSFTSALYYPQDYELGVSDAMQRVDMVLVTWGYDKNASEGSNVRKPVSKLVCLQGLNSTRDMNKDDQSKEEEEDNDSGGFGRREDMLPILVLILPVIALALL